MENIGAHVCRNHAQQLSAIMSPVFQMTRRPVSARQWPQPDFVKKPPMINGWLLILVILCFLTLTWSGWHLVQQIKEFDNLTSQRELALKNLEKLRRDLQPPIPSPMPQKLNAAIAAAYKIEAGLSPAWADFFSAVEAVSTSDITWLGLERASTQSSVRIEGAATTMDAIFGAVAALSTQPRWSGVSLIRVQTAPDLGSFNFELSGQFSPGKPDTH